MTYIAWAKYGTEWLTGRAIDVHGGGNVYTCRSGPDFTFCLYLKEKKILSSRRHGKSQGHRLDIINYNSSFCVSFFRGWFVDKMTYNDGQYIVPNVIVPNIKKLGISMGRFRLFSGADDQWISSVDDNENLAHAILCYVWLCLRFMDD